MTTDLTTARERLEDATDCSGAAREDDEMVVVRVGDLLAVLAGPDEDDVAAAIHRLVADCDEDEAFTAARYVLALFGMRTHDH